MSRNSDPSIDRTHRGNNPVPNHAVPSAEAQAAIDGTVLLAQLKANPRLAGLNLVNAMHNAAGVPTHTERMASDVFTDAMAEALSTDTGRLPGPITFNRTTTPKTRDIHAHPSDKDMAWLLAAEGLSHELLKGGLPDTLPAQAELFAALVEPIKAEFRKRGLDRRGNVVLEAATRYLLHHAKPDLTFVSGGALRRWNADQCDQYDNLDHCDDAGAANHAAARRALLRLTTRRRVLWAHPDGINSGLLIDRFHHTHIKDLVGQDSWVRRKVAEDFTSLADLLRHSAEPHLPGTEALPAVLGVRVLSHRVPNESVHFTATVVGGRITVGRHHVLGGCEVCAPAPAVPNAGATPSRTRGPVVNLRFTSCFGNQAGTGAEVSA